MAVNSNKETLQIEPTVMDHVTFEDAGHVRRNLRSGYACINFFTHELDADRKTDPWLILLLSISLLQAKRLQMKSFPILVSVVAVSTIPLSILPQQKWALAASAKAAWVIYHGKTGFDTFSIRKASLIKKPVLICRRDTSDRFS